MLTTNANVCHFVFVSVFFMHNVALRKRDKLQGKASLLKKENKKSQTEGYATAFPLVGAVACPTRLAVLEL